MNTFSTLLQLSSKTTKADYLGFVKNELDQTVQALQSAGYPISTQAGLIGAQSLKTVNDIARFTYFREMHFIYYGLLNNSWSYDPADKTYFLGLQGFVTKQYDQLS
jgi:hypothetical protein